jgi:hypothetical protein
MFRPNCYCPWAWSRPAVRRIGDVRESPERSNQSFDAVFRRVVKKLFTDLRKDIRQMIDAPVRAPIKSMNLDQLKRSGLANGATNTMVHQLLAQYKEVSPKPHHFQEVMERVRAE